MGEFSNIFKSLRMEAGLTQTDLSKRLKISRSAISMYECGEREPDLEILEKIADFFQVETDYLIGRKLKDSSPFEQEASLEEIQTLIARNGKKLTLEQKQEIIKSLLSD